KVKKRKLYAELVEVTNQTTSNKRATVQKIHASDISMMVGQDTMDKSHQSTDSSINEIPLRNSRKNDCISSKNENDLNIESIVEATASQEINSFNEFLNNEKAIDADEAADDSLFKLLENAKFQTEQNNSFYYNKYLTEHYIKNLLVHMEVYLSCGMVNKAYKTLLRYRKHVQNKSNKSQKMIGLYNIVLEAYASRNDVTKVLELYEMIKNDSLAPSEQTYVYLFDALGKNQQQHNQTDLLKKLWSEMTSNNISFNSIFNEAHFKHDQRENVLKTIRLLLPNFEPTYTKLDTKYKCELINKYPMMDNYQSPAKGIIKLEELKDYMKMQLQNEEDIEVLIESINSPPKNKKVVSAYRAKMKHFENYWKTVAAAAFKRNLKCLKANECFSYNNSLMVLHPFLEVLDSKQYVNAIIREVQKIARGSDAFSTDINSLHIELGIYIYTKYDLETKKQNGVLDKVVSIYQKYLEWYLHPENIEQFDNMNNRTVWEYIQRQEENIGTSINLTCSKWPLSVLISVGKFLYNIILNDLLVTPDLLKGQEIKSSIPAFYTLFRNKKTYLAEQIKPHPIVSKIYKESQLEILSFKSIFVPSYVPPFPWISVLRGGYIATETDFVRSPINTDTPMQKLQSTPLQQLHLVFDSLNQLSSIPWTINSRILDIIIKIFREGGSKELNIPQSISTLSFPPDLPSDASFEEKQERATAVSKHQQRKYEIYSIWCDTLYKLTIANHFRNKIFWLPHNIDFRGRVYPLPPHLNHLSSDVGRSILLFAKGKPLGPKGLDWLKLHVINLTSLKKSCSLKERLEYANENLDNILDSANNPLTGKMWWKESEEPWQTLACCMEIADALKAPDIEKYESRFPVHQDGSCNGLQHYAALGRDQIGAESVNLYPFDVPKDIYTTVTLLVEKNRKADAKNNVKIAQVLDGYIKRKVIKQTVMTTVYGVTKYGAKQQIVKQLKDIEQLPAEFLWPSGTYLTENTFSTLRSMFTSAREIQEWFRSCATVISLIRGEIVEWNTPLGFPVVQPYIKQDKTTKKADTMKQKNAFAPNFIHSLDSAHMMLTSLHCQSAGVTYVSVHDCFWTHASSVDTMNKICREQFVALHTEPILENLSEFFIQRYLPILNTVKIKADMSPEKVHQIFINVPAKGSFDIKNVLSSTYFFS
ncbi:PREDICTED: DNA-directed RNA polymerase, mitochondrial, partial [Dufourea novaeangliae]|uniref:DNA-directed RNA polymerase, mitochondrial n=1 Tax=Dufourea novaeangliae TaxID=178035 RepID=UPI0007678A88